MSTMTRRGLVAAAPVAIVAASVPALAAGATGDAHLFDLGRRLVHLKVLAAEADRQQSAAEARYDKIVPPKPEALFVRPGDRHAMEKRPEMRNGQPTGRFEYDVDLEVANKQLATWSDWPDCDREVLRHHAPDVDASLDATLARLREIVECHTAWTDAREAASNAAGIPEAEWAAAKAHGCCRFVMREIAWRQAATVAGVMLKARVAMQCFGDTLDEAEAEIDDEIEASGCAESLALSIVKDLARMAPQSTMGGANA